MNFRAHALDLFRQALARIETARLALAKGNLPYAVRSSQEAVELALKAAMEWVNVEYPKVHDLSDALRMIREKFPEPFRAHVDDMARISEETARLRARATYGLEGETRGPSEVFRSRKEAARIVADSAQVLRQVRGLLHPPRQGREAEPDRSPPRRPPG